MKDQANTPRDNETQDARDYAKFLRKQRDRNSLLSNLIDVALSSYMNGINDATRSYKASLHTAG